MRLGSFWAGGRLGVLELASLRSFLRQGHRITVFSPEPMELPAGVEWRDANSIMPSKQIATYRSNGSPALHANMFRYALLRQTDMVWVDLDVVALRPFDFVSPWIFGFEDEANVNNAVLGLPPDSQALDHLLQFTPTTVGLPPFFSGWRRLKYNLRTLGRGLPIDRWPWGSTGPRGLTHALRLSGEIVHAQGVEAFYKVPKNDAEQFLLPGALTSESFGPEVYAVHLWAKEVRQLLKSKYGGRVPDGSFVDLMLNE